MRSLLFLFLFVCVSLDFVYGQGGSVEYSSQFFPTGGRRVYVKGDNDEVVLDISVRLARHGSIVTSNVLSRIFARKVSLQRVSQVQGHSSGYSIVVRSKRIVISYTSDEMLEGALGEFYTLFAEPYGQRMVRGCSLYYYTGSVGGSGSYSTIRQNQSGIFDGVSSKQSMDKVVEEITHKLKRKRGSDFMLAVGNKRSLRLRFDVFEGFDDSVLVGEGGYYSDLEILGFVQAAQKAHGNFVLGIDLLSDGGWFEELTGHSMESIEGMRFVRGMMEECKSRFGVNKLCVGTISRSNVSKEYLEFLFYIAARNNITLVIL